MVDFLYTRSIVKIREMSFASFKDIKFNGVSVVYLHSNDIQDLSNDIKNCFSEKQYTLCSDLGCSEDELKSLISKNCRYEIRRAEKEGAVVEVYDHDIPKEIIDEFEKTYNVMFQIKRMSYKFNRAIVKNGIQNHQLIITRAFYDDNLEAIYHAYLCDGKSTVLMYSASPLWKESDKKKSNAIGRLNKYQHWQDMRYFKSKQYDSYEWGGLSSFENPNGIDRFKMEFGGEQRIFYNYTVGKGILGKLYVDLVKRKANE